MKALLMHFKIGDKWYIKTGEEVTYTTGTISSGKTGSFMTAPFLQLDYM